MLELVHWLVRLRLVDECFILNNTAVATIVSDADPGSYRSLKEELPPWLLFFTIAGHDYYPEERVDYRTKDMKTAAQRVALSPAKSLAGISAYQFQSLFRRPSREPYWKLSREGACEDLFFLTTYDRLPEQIRLMHSLADETGHPAPEIGCYLQPLVQGASCHCEFNLFYSPETKRELERVRQLSTLATKNLLDRGAFFSRPYGESARMIMNRDAATVAALKKIKGIFDPHNIMNPGKLCF